jgi:hypothetical protein
MIFMLSSMNATVAFWSRAGPMRAKTRLNVSCGGEPFSRGMNFLSSFSLERPKSAIESHVSAPGRIARKATARISRSG